MIRASVHVQQNTKHALQLKVDMRSDNGDILYVGFGSNYFSVFKRI